MGSNSIPTGFNDKNGLPLFVGDKIKVPDNPDIVPYDIGHIVQATEPHIFDPDCDFIFMGQVGRFPLSVYKSDEIKRLK